MKDLWEQIAQLRGIELPPPATLDELDDFVAQCGFITLPDDMRESYLATNGGWRNDMFISDVCFNTLERTLGGYSMLTGLLESGDFDRGVRFGSHDTRNPNPYIRPYHWTPKWLPIMSFGEFYWCVDCDPTPQGKYGQIIEWDHETGGEALVAVSLRILMERIIERLENGRLPVAIGSDEAETKEHMTYFYNHVWRNIGTPDEVWHD